VFITFEGPEGAGKTTQANLLSSFLEKEGFSVLLTYEPGASKVGKEIRNILLEKEVEISAKAETLLYLADRAEHVQHIILPALKENKIVICDRFFDSTVAYQGFGRGLEVRSILEINDWATDKLKPDLTFILDLPVEAGLQRLKNGFLDRLEKEKIEFHQKVREGFLAIAKKEPERIKIIDALLPITLIHRQVKDIVVKYL